jgi:hypothetical protein
MTKKLNLDFIGEIVSSPAGMCSWYGTTVTFYGKFKDGDYKHESDKFNRENLIEAILIQGFGEGGSPSKDHYMCSAFQEIPEKYLFIEDEK